MKKPLTDGQKSGRMRLRTWDDDFVAGRNVESQVFYEKPWEKTMEKTRR